MTALLGIDTRLQLARLLLVSDSRRDDNDLEGFADAALGAGVDIVQLRDDSISDSGKLAALETLRTVAFRYRRLVSVYADAHLAQAFGADLLQLPKGPADAGKARAKLHEWARIGRACYSAADVDEALADPDVHFLTVGPVYGTLPLFGRTPGPDLVRYAAQAAPPARKGSKPWFAIGGITAANLDEVLAAGARRVAVGRAITAADDPAGATRELGERLRAAWNADPAMEAVTLNAFGQGD